MYLSLGLRAVILQVYFPLCFYLLQFLGSLLLFKPSGVPLIDVVQRFWGPLPSLVFHLFSKGINIPVWLF